MRLLLTLLLLNLLLFARHNAKPSLPCEAYNNMKHTKNTHSVMLDTTKKYTILKEHKGQKLLLIKGENPAQRWVDDACFYEGRKRKNLGNVAPARTTTINLEDELGKASRSMAVSKHTKKYEDSGLSKQNLLVLSWHNAFCETHRHKKECKNSWLFGKKKYGETHFVLHGLWPQPKSRMYCNIDRKDVARDKHKQWNRLPKLGLNSDIKEGLKKIMPGFSSNLHRHEWIKHGSCYGADANSYYADAIKLVKQVNYSKVGDFFKKNIGKSVTLKQIRHLFNRSFGAGTGKHVEMKCNKGLVTELWLHLGSGSSDIGTLLKDGRTTRSRCREGRIDKAGFGR